MTLTFLVQFNCLLYLQSAGSDKVVSECTSLSDVKFEAIKQNIEVSEQIQNIEFSSTLQLTEEGDIQKKGIISPSQTLTGKLVAVYIWSCLSKLKADNSI